MQFAFLRTSMKKANLPQRKKPNPTHYFGSFSLPKERMALSRGGLDIRCQVNCSIFPSVALKEWRNQGQRTKCLSSNASDPREKTTASLQNPAQWRIQPHSWMRVCRLACALSLVIITPTSQTRVPGFYPQLWLLTQTTPTQTLGDSAKGSAK